MVQTPEIQILRTGERRLSGATKPVEEKRGNTQDTRFNERHPNYQTSFINCYVLVFFILLAVVVPRDNDSIINYTLTHSHTHKHTHRRI